MILIDFLFIKHTRETLYNGILVPTEPFLASEVMVTSAAAPCVIMDASRLGHSATIGRWSNPWG